MNDVLNLIKNNTISWKEVIQKSSLCLDEEFVINNINVKKNLVLLNLKEIISKNLKDREGNFLEIAICQSFLEKQTNNSLEYKLYNSVVNIYLNKLNSVGNKNDNIKINYNIQNENIFYYILNTQKDNFNNLNNIKKLYNKYPNILNNKNINDLTLLDIIIKKSYIYPDIFYYILKKTQLPKNNLLNNLRDSFYNDYISDIFKKIVSLPNNGLFTIEKNKFSGLNYNESFFDYNIEKFFLYNYPDKESIMKRPIYSSALFLLIDYIYENKEKEIVNILNNNPIKIKNSFSKLLSENYFVNHIKEINEIIFFIEKHILTSNLDKDKQINNKITMIKNKI